MATKQELDEAVIALREGKKVHAHLNADGCESNYVVQLKDGALWVLAEDEPITGNTRMGYTFEKYPVTQDDGYKDTLLQVLEYLVLWGSSAERTNKVIVMDFAIEEKT
jgi:hypothetical protein